MHPTVNGFVAQYGERSKVLDRANCEPTSGNAEVSDGLESQAGHVEQSPKGLGEEEGERAFMGWEEDDLKNVGLFVSSESSLLSAYSTVALYTGNNQIGHTT